MRDYVRGMIYAASLAKRVNEPASIRVMETAQSIHDEDARRAFNQEVHKYMDENGNLHTSGERVY